MYDRLLTLLLLWFGPFGLTIFYALGFGTIA
jgi:hypothetical protein